MGNYNNFNKALAAGKVGEDLVLDYMTAIGYHMEDVSGDKDFQKRDIDFLACYKGNRMAIEVKADSRVAETGNLVVETCTNIDANKKGWFFTTQATHIFFVDVVNNIVHCARMDELKQLYRTHGYRHYITKQYECGVFYKEAQIAIIPLEDVKQLPHYVELTPEVVAA